MTVVDIVAVAVGIAVLAVAFALVPALIEVRRAARSLDRFLLEAGPQAGDLAGRAARLLDDAGRLVNETRGRLDRAERAASALKVPVAGALAGFLQLVNRGKRAE